MIYEKKCIRCEKNYTTNKKHSTICSKCKNNKMGWSEQRWVRIMLRNNT